MSDTGPRPLTEKEFETIRDEIVSTMSTALCATNTAGFVMLSWFDGNVSCHSDVPPHVVLGVLQQALPRVESATINPTDTTMQ